MEAILSRVLEMRIPADARYISLVRRGVRSLAESAGFSREDVADVEVAVSEAVANSVEHGSPDSGASDVLVKCSASSDSLVVEIEDRSTADSLPPNPPLLDPSSERGRGVTMMRELMDECEDYRTEYGIKVRMAKQKAR